MVGVHDGDTLKILTADKKQVTIRLSQIDAPELKQAYGQQSKKALSNLCFNQNARANVETHDRYQRAVAIVYCNGKEANIDIVRQGLAWVFRKYASLNNYYQAELEAKKAKINIWSQSNPKPPWEFRKR